MPPTRAGFASDLLVGFAGSYAVVRGGGPELRASLEETLRHVLVTAAGDAPPAARYTISGSAGVGYSLSRDGEPIVANLGAFDLGERLLYELTLTLARAVVGRPVLHAAGLAVAERGLVLAGASGSGKSTLTTRLAARGAGVLSDELIALAPDGGEMLGFARPIALKGGGESVGTAWLAAASRETARPGADGTVRLDPAGLGSGMLPRAARPSVVFFPRYVAGAPVEVQPLSRAAALFRLLAGLMNAAAFADRGLSALGAALGGVAAYGLRYGDGEAAADEVWQLARWDDRIVRPVCGRLEGMV